MFLVFIQYLIFSWIVFGHFFVHYYRSDAWEKYSVSHGLGDGIYTFMRKWLRKILF